MQNQPDDIPAVFADFSISLRISLSCNLIRLGSFSITMGLICREAIRLSNACVNVSVSQKDNCS